MPPHEVAERWTDDELLDLQALNHVDPSGDSRLDLLFAILQQTVARFSMGCSKVPPLDEFLLESRFKKAEEAATKQDTALKDELSGWARSRNSVIALKR